jgi:hypothetical protein
MDVQDISPGQDFAEAIENTISACQAVLVVIGPRWVVDLQNRSGKEDFVRHEVSVALRRNVTLIPILVGGCSMPTPAELPEELAALSRRQALEIRDSSFEADAKLLATTLQRATGLSLGPDHARHKRWGLVLIATFLLLASVSFFFWKQRPRAEISGTWIAEMKKANQPTYRVGLDFASVGGKITGSARYPTGDGSIQGGTLERGRLMFFTVHVPQFASEPATIQWAGVIDGNVIRFRAADENGVATGIAHLRP